MKTRRISGDLAVAGQISTDDLPMVHSLGFKSVMCNRPDGEDAQQEVFEAIDKAAKNAGLLAQYVPIASASPTGQETDHFAEAYAMLPKPIFAYTKHGDRSEAAFNAMQLRAGGNAA